MDTPLDELVKAMGTLTTDEERRQFLEAFLSPDEATMLASRWAVFLGLLTGKKQRTIQRELNVGIATVSRANRQLIADGSIFHFVFSRLKSSC